MLYPVPFLMIINPYRFAAAGGGIPRDNLEIEYLFSSGTTTTPDTSGNANDCTLVNNATISGGVIDFDGNNDYGEADNIVSIGTGSMSWSFWFETDNTSKTVAMVRQGRNGSAGNARYDGLQVLLVSGKIRGAFLDFDNSGLYFEKDSAGSVSAATWYHVALVLDASAETMELFVDGSSEGSVSVSTAAPWNITSTGTPSIGSREVNDGNFTADDMNGRLDNVRLYSDALTSAEVTELYNEGHD